MYDRENKRKNIDIIKENIDKNKLKKAIKEGEIIYIKYYNLMERLK